MFPTTNTGNKFLLTKVASLHGLKGRFLFHHHPPGIFDVGLEFILTVGTPSLFQLNNLLKIIFDGFFSNSQESGIKKEPNGS